MNIFKTLALCLLMAAGFGTPMRAHGDGQFVHADLMASMQPGDKAALLVVHFGTTHDDTRALTLDAITERMRREFPSLEVREAYTSRIVMRRLGERGIRKLNPVQALAGLLTDGYTHVIIQSTNVIDGIEMESLRRDAAQMAPLFKEIRIGTPLLYAPDDYRQVIRALSEQETGGAFTLLIGHGTYTPTTAQYAMLDYMLHASGHEDYAVATVEGYPSLDDALAYVRKQKKVRRLRLVPFMLVAGDHAKNDIAGEMRERLEREGYEVEVMLEGLGQQEAIQDIFVAHARFMLTHRLQDIQAKKKAYAAGQDKSE